MYFAKVTTLLVSEGAFLDHKVNLLIIAEVVVIVGYPNLLTITCGWCQRNTSVFIKLH